MQMQAEDLRIYALAYALWHDDTYLQAAHFVAGVLLADQEMTSSPVHITTCRSERRSEGARTFHGRHPATDSVQTDCGCALSFYISRLRRCRSPHEIG